jgi:hypothetical protein
MARTPQAKGLSGWTVERRMKSQKASELVAGEHPRQQLAKKTLSVSKIASKFEMK